MALKKRRFTFYPVPGPLALAYRPVVCLHLLPDGHSAGWRGKHHAVRRDTVTNVGSVVLVVVALMRVLWPDATQGLWRIRRCPSSAPCANGLEPH